MRHQEKAMRGANVRSVVGSCLDMMDKAGAVESNFIASF
jgi:hypothetical protein